MNSCTNSSRICDGKGAYAHVGELFAAKLWVIERKLAGLKDKWKLASNTFVFQGGAFGRTLPCPLCGYVHRFRLEDEVLNFAHGIGGYVEPQGSLVRSWERPPISALLW